MNDDFDNLYGSKYFSVPDLKGGQLRRKVGRVDIAELTEKDGSTRKKYAVYFDGEDKALILNKTNALKLASAFGKNRIDWIGMSVELYPEMTGLGKEGVRVRPLRKAMPPAQPDPDPDNEIPF